MPGREPIMVLEELAKRVTSLLASTQRLLVAIDGPDAAGKTTLAAALVAQLDVPVLSASVDDFHQPRALRHQRGSLSAEGYYRDTFDYTSLRRLLLQPFRDSAPQVHTRSLDYQADRSDIGTPQEVPAVAVLLMEGVFLLRPELRGWWSLSIYIDVAPEESLRRGMVRDRHLYESDEQLVRRYRERYLAGQELYRAEADPRATADIVL